MHLALSLPSIILKHHQNSVILHLEIHWLLEFKGGREISETLEMEGPQCLR